MSGYFAGFTLWKVDLLVGNVKKDANEMSKMSEEFAEGKSSVGIVTHRLLNDS